MKVVIILFACVATALSRRPDFPCDKICPRYGFKPICSSNNNDFSNDCYLECYWEYKACDGNCPCAGSQQPVYQPPTTYCGCSWDYDPVCASDGETYHNKCVAECENGKYVWYDGVCY
ncbi:lariat debranching enzyme [Mactra antiquata]